MANEWGEFEMTENCKICDDTNHRLGERKMNEKKIVKIAFLKMFQDETNE